MTSSVNVSQPISLCDAGFPFSTVSMALSRNMPCCAQRVRLPCVGKLPPTSSCTSLKMFCSDGGVRFSSGTEKHRPCACPLPW